MAKEQTPPEIPFSGGSQLALITNQPPFFFKGITMRVFPVRANMATLREFCDQYLNFVPAEVARYQPSAPFVQICVINYGPMRSAQDVGWVAQNEIAFTVPLEWYQEKDGKREFKGLVSFSPFIFVDIEMSEITGREVYGWPKEYAVLSSQIHSWARNPRAPQNLLSVDTRRQDSSSPQGWSKARLLEVLHRPPASFSLFPPEATNPFNLAGAAARAAWGSWFWWRNAGDMVAGSPLRGFWPTSPSDLVQMAGNLAGKAGPMALAPFASQKRVEESLANLTVNLKQFHATGNPGRACYQALINSKMTMKRLNRGGFLGDMTLLSGDPTGGFRLRLRRDRAANIITALGLEEDLEDRFADGASLKLKPFLPFWVDFDVQYGRGEALAWRILGEMPSRSHGETEPPPPFEEWQHWRTPESGKIGIPPGDTDRGEFRDARQVGWEAMISPYETPDSTLRVLPLLADEEKLASFCDEYLNTPLGGFTGTYFEPWGRHVFLLASSYQKIADATGGVHDVVVRDLLFALPVVLKRGNVRDRSSEDPVINVGVIYPYWFTDNEVASIILRERAGFPVLRARLDSPETIWMEAFRPELSHAKLLVLKTELQGARSAGEPVTERELMHIEVTTTPMWEKPWELLTPADDVDLTGALEQAERLLTSASAFNRYTLKQYPASRGPEAACYQALVDAPFTILPLPAAEFMRFPKTLLVGISRFPSLPIVERLGLVVAETRHDGTRTIDYLNPDEPFYVKASFRYEIEQGICWRGRGVDWKPDPPHFPETSTLQFDPAGVTPKHVIDALVARKEGEAAAAAAEVTAEGAKGAKETQ